MSLFGVKTTAAPAFGVPAPTSATSTAGLFGQAAAPASTGLFGQPSGAAAAQSTGFKLPNFGSPATTTSAGAAAPSFNLGTLGAPASTAAATSGLSLFGSTAAPTTAAASNALTVTAPAATVGLGGTSGLTVTGNLNANANTQAGQATETVKTKPTDMNVPQPIEQLYNELTQQLTENKRLSDELNTDLLASITELDKQIDGHKTSVSSIHSSLLGQTKEEIHQLKEQVRNDTRFAERLQRQYEPTVPSNQLAQFNALIESSYLPSLVAQQEHNLEKYSEKLAAIQNLITKRISGPEKSAAITKQELIKQVKYLDAMLSALAVKVAQAHDSVQDAKDSFMRYQRLLHGRAAVDPFSDCNINLGTDQSISAANRSSINDSQSQSLIGPDPFESPSMSAWMALAASVQQTAQTQQPVGFTGLGTAPPTQSLFAAQPNTLGQWNTSNSAAGGLFGAKPAGTFSFTNTATSTAAAPFKPFASVQPTTSQTGLFGAASTSAANQVKFGSPLTTNTAAGSLFSNTNVGVVRPFGK